MIGKNLRKMVNYCSYCSVCEKRKHIPCLCFGHYSGGEKQVILLMIPNGEGWHYLAVKKLLALLRIIFWLAFIPLEEKTNLNLIKNHVKIKLFVML